VQANNLATLVAMLSVGARTDLRDMRGQTALDHARATKRADMIAALEKAR
jgi:ankyrin repeat protein